MAENENVFEFRSFDKIARLSREVIVTEKLDGTNAQILITRSMDRGMYASHVEKPPVAVFAGDWHDPNAVDIYAGSRNRWIHPGADNYGFAGWVSRNVEELKKLGPGRHYGEWWGNGIQRGYGLKEKRFSLFNTSRWYPIYCSHPEQNLPIDVQAPGVFQLVVKPDGTHTTLEGPACCHVVPVIWKGEFDTQDIDNFIEMLNREGSFAAPRFMNPEGVVIFHTAAGLYFKKTCKDDEKRKSQVCHEQKTCPGSTIG